MTVNALICFALICCTFGFVAGYIRPERYDEELNAMPRSLSIYDNEGNAVNITMEEVPKERGARMGADSHPPTFTLYTKNNPTEGQKLRDLKTLRNSHFDSNNPTRFITHGWTDNGEGLSCLLIRDAYLESNSSKENVIVVDWSYISQKPYIWAANNIESVSLQVAKMIDFLVEQGNMNVNTTTLIGHSLGAHVMGIAGWRSKYKIRHVVGLDPALPMFNFALDHESISKESGAHVQIIHTNAGVTGYLNPAGHSDFYPNGGILQPGCCDSPTPGTCTRCSHFRAVELFAESLTKPFEGVLCTNYEAFTTGYCSIRPHTTLMGGFSTELPKPGKYYFTTRSYSPFSVT